MLNFYFQPCDECIFLVSKFLPWSGTIGYTDIYYKILAWVEKYCDEIWSKKEFALLPYDVIKKCFIHHTLDIVCIYFLKFYIHLFNYSRSHSFIFMISL